MSTTAAPRASQREPSPQEELRLLGVLESGLPAQLGTVDEPERYTVPVVFSRQVTRAERERIEDPETARRLAVQAGAAQPGPDLRLVVSDRRLLIESTNLYQLRDGLAEALAEMLRDLGRDERAARSERAVEAESRAVEEEYRVSAVHAVVESIRFE